VNRDQLNKESIGLQGKEVFSWIEKALEYVQSEGKKDFEMISKVIWFGLFTGDSEFVDELVLAQDKKYESYLSKACAPKVVEVAINDAIAYGRMTSLKSPLKVRDEVQGLNLLMNLCTKTPSVDTIIESIKILRSTFGDELTLENYKVLAQLINDTDAIFKQNKIDVAVNAPKNVRVNITFGLMYAWSATERAKLLAILEGNESG
jgi:hypothetical protein